MLPEVVVEGGRHFGHPVLVHERQHGGLDRCHLRVELKDDSGLPLDLFLSVGVGEHRQGNPVGARRGFDDEGQEPLAGGLLEVL